MRKILILLYVIFFYSLFPPTTTHANWGGTIPDGSEGCFTKTFNSCSDPLASCVGNNDVGTNGTCKVISNPIKDICAGYQDGDSTHTQQTGICYYSVNGTLPSCKELTGTDYHQNPNYHHISDEITPCAGNGGNTYQCCAPDAQPSPTFPPPPCTGGGKDNTTCVSVNTGLGSISTDPSSLVGTIVSLLLGISGGIATVIIIISGYRIVFSQGDPEKLKAAQEAITSAIIGLLFIIFSVVILRIIGVDILHIPGLNP